MALPGLGRALVLAGKLNQATAQALYRKALQARTSFIAELTGSGAVSAIDLARVLSTAFGVPLVDVDTLEIEHLPTDLLDTKTCVECRILVLGQRDNRLVVATADPTDQQAVERIRFATQMGVDWVIAEYDKLGSLLERLNAANRIASGVPTDTDFGLGDLEAGADRSDEAAATSEIEDAPVVKFLHGLLHEAVRMRASDMHFEPYEDRYRVRFRIDGELRDIASPPTHIKDKLASRIKILSRLDISEKRLPQDGRLKLKLETARVIDLRVSTLPTLFGEKVVIRVLDPNNNRVDIDALGYEPEEKERLLSAIRRPDGMVLVTGPTGSGKTVSLYTCLNLLNQPGVNISTVEDPAEMGLAGINQVNVNEKTGLTFATVLRAFLRQDPDIIMVGEIRDLDTADISIKAAQTGHLVLSTLHTHDAPTTLTRLMNMGVPAFNIASSVILITAQRLLRRLCTQCRQPVDIPRTTLLAAGFPPQALDGTWTPYRAMGCAACHQGFRGRVGIYQVMPVSEGIQRIILEGGHAMDIARQALDEGVRTLRQSGLVKVRQGLTTLEEVLSATSR